MCDEKVLKEQKDEFDQLTLESHQLMKEHQELLDTHLSMALEIIKGIKDAQYQSVCFEQEGAFSASANMNEEE